MTEHLTPETAEIILNTLPEKIQLGLRADAAQIEYPGNVLDVLLRLSESAGIEK